MKALNRRAVEKVEGRLNGFYTHDLLIARFFYFLFILTDRNVARTNAIIFRGRQK